MSLQQYIRSLREGEDPKAPSGGRGGRGGGWGPSGPVSSPSSRINDLAMLLASKGLTDLAAAQIQADSGALGSGLIGAAARRDKINAAAQTLGTKKNSTYRGPQRTGSSGKVQSGFGGKDFKDLINQQRQWVIRDANRKAQMADAKEMEQFRANLENQQLAQKMSILLKLFPGSNARRTTDTATREELVNIAGRPEKRSLSSSQTKDNSMEILQQIMRMV